MNGTHRERCRQCHRTVNLLTTRYVAADIHHFCASYKSDIHFKTGRTELRLALCAQMSQLFTIHVYCSISGVIIMQSRQVPWIVEKRKNSQTTLWALFHAMYCSTEYGEEKSRRVNNTCYNRTRSTGRNRSKNRKFWEGKRIEIMAEKSSLIDTNKVSEEARVQTRRLPRKIIIE